MSRNTLSSIPPNLTITVPEDGVVTLPIELRGFRVVIHQEGNSKPIANDTLQNGMERFIQFCEKLNMPPLSDSEIDQLRQERIMQKFDRCLKTRGEQTCVT